MKKTFLFLFLFTFLTAGVCWADDVEEAQPSERKMKPSQSVSDATSATMNGIQGTVDLRGLIADLKKGDKGLRDVDAAMARALAAEDLDAAERIVQIRRHYLYDVAYTSAREAECTKDYAAKELRCSSKHRETAKVTHLVQADAEEPSQESESE
jgi:hypothetical protein